MGHQKRITYTLSIDQIVAEEMAHSMEVVRTKNEVIARAFARLLHGNPNEICRILGDNLLSDTESFYISVDWVNDEDTEDMDTLLYFEVDRPLFTQRTPSQ